MDYFRFTLREPKQVYLALRQLDYNTDLALEDESGKQLKASSKSGTSNESVAKVLLEGIYYIRVDARVEGQNAYVLRYGVNTANPDKVAALRRAANRLAAELPSVSGTARVGETLTADTSAIADEDGLIGVSFSYQWVRSDGTTDTDISGATTSTYTLLWADVGKTFSVRVSFTDQDGNAEMRTSAATVPVVPSGDSPIGGRR